MYTIRRRQDGSYCIYLKDFAVVVAEFMPGYNKDAKNIKAIFEEQAATERQRPQRRAGRRGGRSMKVARGKVRELLIIIGEIQNLVGVAKNVARNDRDKEQLTHLLELLDKAFKLCLEARSEYRPIVGLAKANARARSSGSGGDKE